MGRAAVLALAAALTCPAAARGTTLERVELSGGAATVVHLRLTGPVAVRTEARPPQGGRPDRLLVDLPGTRLGVGARGGAGSRGPLLRVLAEELEGPTVRLTLELDAPVPFVVESREREVRILLGEDTPAPAPPSVPPVEQPRPGDSS